MIACLARGPGAIAARSSRCDERCTSEAASLPRFELGNMRMATAGRVPCVDSFFESGAPQSRRGGKDLGPPPALASRLLTLSAMLCAVAVAGCAQNSATRENKADPTHAAALPHGHSELRIRRPDRALLVSQPAPDCEFKRSDLKTVDPDQWARLKLDYERQCYQDAEKMVRDRLRLLQAASRCEIEPARQPLTTIR